MVPVYPQRSSSPPLAKVTRQGLPDWVLGGVAVLILLGIGLSAAAVTLTRARTASEVRQRAWCMMMTARASQLGREVAEGAVVLFAKLWVAPSRSLGGYTTQDVVFSSAQAENPIGLFPTHAIDQLMMIN
jgi:hypothetical protein